VDSPDCETRAFQDRRRPSGLPLAGFNDEIPSGLQPRSGFGGNSAVEIQPVRTAVERPQRFVLARFVGHGVYRAGGDIRGIDGQHADSSLDGRGQSTKKVTLVNFTTHAGQVPACAVHCCRVNVRSVQFEPVNAGCYRNTYCTGPAAQIDDDCGLHAIAALPRQPLLKSTVRRQIRRQQGRNLVDQEFGAAARNENACIQLNPQSAELRPAEYVFERIPGNSPLHRQRHFGRAGCGGQKKPGFLLGKDTPGRTKPRRETRHGDSRPCISGFDFRRRHANAFP
jgi:hypothetical protein